MLRHQPPPASSKNHPHADGATVGAKTRLSSPVFGQDANGPRRGRLGGPKGWCRLAGSIPCVQMDVQHISKD